MGFSMTLVAGNPGCVDPLGVFLLLSKEVSCAFALKLCYIFRLLPLAAVFLTYWRVSIRKSLANDHYLLFMTADH